MKLIHSLHSSRDSRQKETLVANKHENHRLPPGAPDAPVQFSLRVFCWLEFHLFGFGVFLAVHQHLERVKAVLCECLLAVTD